MVRPFLVLLICQLAGSAIASVARVSIPGPVIGMALLLAVLLSVPRLYNQIQSLAHVLIRHMAILFIPAGVGVMVIQQEIEEHSAVCAAVIIVSTWVTALVTAGVFVLANRWRRGKGAL